MNTDEIRQLVASGDLEEAFQRLLSHTRGTALYNTAVQLNARFNALKNKELRGIVSFENAELVRNQITHDLLELLEGRPVPGLTERRWGWKKIAAAAGSFIVFGAAVAEFSGYNLRSIFLNENTANTAAVQTPLTTLAPSTAPNDTPATKKIAEPPSLSATEKRPDAPQPATADTVLRIALKTNKGANNLRYRAGETLNLYFQANQPCHVRFIYRLADGSLVLFDDDRAITAAETGRYLEIGSGFSCEAPFGAETLYAFAQTGPFPALRTESADGYRLVLEGLPDALRKTRGFKKKYRFAEASLNITTTEQ